MREVLETFVKLSNDFQDHMQIFGGVIEHLRSKKTASRLYRAALGWGRLRRRWL